MDTQFLWFPHIGQIHSKQHNWQEINQCSNKNQAIHTYIYIYIHDTRRLWIFQPLLLECISGCSSSQLASKIPRKNEEIQVVQWTLWWSESWKITYQIYLEPICPLFWGVEPSKRRPKFQSKQGSFGVPGIYIYNSVYNIYIHIHSTSPFSTWDFAASLTPFVSTQALRWLTQHPPLGTMQVDPRVQWCTWHPKKSPNLPTPGQVPKSPRNQPGVYYQVISCGWLEFQQLLRLWKGN